jgi:hypothetical protein
LVTPVRIVRSPEPRFDKELGGGGGGRATNIAREDAGDDVIADVDQLNWMRDNDQFTDSARLSTADLDLSAVFVETAEVLAAAHELVLKVLPDDLAPASSTSTELIDWAAARTPEQTPDRESNEWAQDLLPGRYANGELVVEEDDTAGTDDEPEAEAVAASTGSEDGTDSQDESEASEEEEEPPLSIRPEVGEAPVYVYGEVETGQVARTGGNIADNVTQIVDVNGVAGTMIVMGDWFETNAIIQTNIYSDRDHVARAGGGTGGDIETGGNVADNVAELITGNPWSDVELPEFKGKFIYCDVVDGDFYDVKALTQTNWLQDHDVVVQESSTSFAVVATGENSQYNGFFLQQPLDYYDLIIVGGDYHSANLIYQTNIVLDDDWVVVSGPGGGGDGDGSSVFTGQNWLFNTAAIKDYGLDDAAPLPFHLELLASQIAAGGDVVDVQAAWGLAGNGSQTLKVLYIKGDYYDLNVVNQVNVILDADVVVQNLPNGGRLGDVQYASTGHNAATNDATIVTANAVDALFVGGEHYEDSILIQANIVVGDDDEVCTDNCSDLPPEIVAFTTDCEEAPPCDEPMAAPVAAYNDMLSNIVT